MNTLVLRNFEEYKRWYYENNLCICDVFTEDEVTTWMENDKPSEYPCIIYPIPKEKESGVDKFMYITLNEIERWCHLLRTHGK